MSEKYPFQYVQYACIAIIVIGIGALIFSEFVNSTEVNSQIYLHLKEKCENNNGELWFVHNDCVRPPFVDVEDYNKYLENKDGYYCKYQNGTEEYMKVEVIL